MSNISKNVKILSVCVRFNLWNFLTGFKYFLPSESYSIPWAIFYLDRWSLIFLLQILDFFIEIIDIIIIININIVLFIIGLLLMLQYLVWINFSTSTSHCN